MLLYFFLDKKQLFDFSSDVINMLKFLSCGKPLCLLSCWGVLKIWTNAPCAVHLPRSPYFSFSSPHAKVSFYSWNLGSVFCCFLILTLPWILIITSPWSLHGQLLPLITISPSNSSLLLTSRSSSAACLCGPSRTCIKKLCLTQSRNPCDSLCPTAFLSQVMSERLKSCRRNRVGGQRLGGQ